MIAVIADLLSLIRVLAAGVLVWLGVTRGAAALPQATLAAVLGWTSDLLDGIAARRAGRPTHLGKFDFLFDVLLYAGTLTYLALAGYVPAGLALAYGVVAAVISAASRRKAVAVLFLRLIDVACLMVLFMNLPWAGIAIVGWLTVLAWIYRKRVAVGVSKWIGQLAGLVSGHAGREPPKGGEQ
jgi:phosphatidylglycerophosphate synthase